MSFSGRRYKRVGHENMDELLKATNINEDSMRFLQQEAPVFCFDRLNGDTFKYTLEAPNMRRSFDFTLGEEIEVERRDGVKVKVLYTMPSENVLNQVIKVPGGHVVHFSREFSGKKAKMTVAVEGRDKKATIYFEEVE